MMLKERMKETVVVVVVVTLHTGEASAFPCPFHKEVRGSSAFCYVRMDYLDNETSDPGGPGQIRRSGFRVYNKKFRV